MKFKPWEFIKKHSKGEGKVSTFLKTSGWILGGVALGVAIAGVVAMTGGAAALVPAFFATAATISGIAVNTWAVGRIAQAFPSVVSSIGKRLSDFGTQTKARRDAIADIRNLTEKRKKGHDMMSGPNLKPQHPSFQQNRNSPASKQSMAQNPQQGRPYSPQNQPPPPRPQPTWQPERPMPGNRRENRPAPIQTGQPTTTNPGQQFSPPPNSPPRSPPPGDRSWPDTPVSEETTPPRPQPTWQPERPMPGNRRGNRPPPIQTGQPTTTNPGQQFSPPPYSPSRSPAPGYRLLPDTPASEQTTPPLFTPPPTNPMANTPPRSPPPEYTPTRWIGLEPDAPPRNRVPKEDELNIKKQYSARTETDALGEVTKYSDGQPPRDVFEERGNQFIVQEPSEAVIANIVKMWNTRGEKELTVDGPPEFKIQVALQAIAADMKVSGLSPEELETVRQLQAKQDITAQQNQTQDMPSPPIKPLDPPPVTPPNTQRTDPPIDQEPLSPVASENPKETSQANSSGPTLPRSPTKFSGNSTPPETKWLKDFPADDQKQPLEIKHQTEAHTFIGKDKTLAATWKIEYVVDNKELPDALKPKQEKNGNISNEAIGAKVDIDVDAQGKRTVKAAANQQTKDKSNALDRQNSTGGTSTSNDNQEKTNGRMRV